MRKVIRRIVLKLSAILFVSIIPSGCIVENQDHELQFEIP
jgi:hypothetical protein